MVKALSYIKIIRPGNAVMTAGTVALGYWVSASTLPLISLALCAAAAICAVGFGNVVNDIRDIEPDRINHPQRPLASGQMNAQCAAAWAGILAAAGLAASALVSPLHMAGYLFPLALLLLYAYRLKTIPLAGNLVVSVLVAYAIIYGAIGAPHMMHVVIPAFLALLLNLSREIVKDIQDQHGDRTHGILTTAVLPQPVLRAMLLWLGIVYAFNALIPYLLGHFGAVYLGMCALILLPLHGTWLALLLGKREAAPFSLVSALIKWEMLGGMAAVALDRLLIR